MKMREALVEAAYIVMGINPVDKTDALKQIAGQLLAAHKYDPKSIDKVQRQLIQREELNTTAFGRGVAYPHVKSSLCRSIHIAWWFHAKGFEFGSVDRRPVHIVCMSLCPDYDVSLHLRTMEMFFRLVRANDRLDAMLQMGNMSSVEQIRSELLRLADEADVVQA